MQVHISPTLTIEYEEAGHGVPVVLLHAFPLSHAMWRPQLHALGSDCRLLTPDLRGFGGSSPFADTASIEQMADDVAAFLDAVNVRKPVVVGGQSMGGYVSLAFARRHAGRLRGLILADTRAEADTDEGRANRDRNIALVESQNPGALIETMLPKLLGDTTRRQRPEIVDEVRRLGSAQTVQGIVGALRAMRDRPDFTPFLAAIPVPVLVLVGAEDTITPPDMAEKMAAAIPQGRLVVVAGAGHLSNLEQPEAYNDAVRTFLQSLP